MDRNLLAEGRRVNYSQLPGLRRPPIDPRKARRHCTDFGLGRDVPPALPAPSPSPPVPDHSSLTSTPLTIYTETEADSDTSSNLEFSFPQPPPLNGSMRLRRMHSSPLFTADDTNAVKYLLKKRYGAGLASAGGFSPAESDHLEGSEDILKDLLEEQSVMDLRMPSLDHISKQLFAGNDTSEPEHLPPPSPITPESDISTSFSSSISTGTVSKASAQEPGEDHIFLKPYKLSTPDKVDTPSADYPSALPVTEITQSLDRLHHSMKKLRTAYDPQSHAAVVPWEYQLQPRTRYGSMPVPTPLQLPPHVPSLASAGRQKPTHRSHLSVPLTGLGITNVNTSNSCASKGLGAPFHHRSTQSQPVARLLSQQESLPKSFINITPEQEARHLSAFRVRKDRLKKMFARASSIIGWNKSFGRKGSV